MGRIQITGVIKKAIKGSKENPCPDGNPHGFIITGDDGKEYYAHLGDLKINEDKLYGNLDIPTFFFEEGDNVQFEIQNPEPDLWEPILLPRALKVKIAD